MLSIKYLSIDELKPYENNPRFNEHAVESVANSIKEFGFKIPIVITKENEIVAGHTRYKASLKLGLETVPCIVADDLNEQQIKAFRLADNKVSELAEWDFEKLEIELSELELDMSLFSFEDLKIEDVIPKQKNKDGFDVIDDEVETKHECPKCGYCW
jgi:site-specific DNA-methyltransferase (adenine-specific)